ncbi:IDEAL domain-containing protein, partial [Staphylococcus warneri]
LIHFPLHVGPDAKLEQLILAQIVQSERYQSYLPYIHTLSSNSTLQHQFLSQLYENIDLSLLMHDTERFTQLTHVLN